MSLVFVSGLNQTNSTDLDINITPTFNYTYIPEIQKTDLIQTSFEGYDLKTRNTSYDLYLKSNSNWGNMMRYCVNESGEEFCLHYQSSEMSYRNQYGSSDYISSIKSVVGDVDGSIINYVGVFPNTNLSFNSEKRYVKELYSISELPREPSTWLGDESQITLDFAGYVDFPNLEIWSNDIEYTSKSFITYEKIEFKKGNKIIFELPKPIAYDSNGSSINLQYEVKKSGNSIWFYIRTPYSWLKNAVYPVYIDPTVWQNYNFYNRIQINVTENSGNTLTNYSVLMNISKQDGMRDNFTDIEFRDENNNTLGYWIEQQSDGNWFSVWVKTLQLNASAVNPIFLYFNSTDAISQSDIKEAFIIADDFNDASIDTSIWVLDQGTNYLGGCSICTESGGEFYVSGSDSAGIWSNIQTFGNGYGWKSRVKMDKGTYGSYGGVGFAIPSTTHNEWTGTYGFKNLVFSWSDTVTNNNPIYNNVDKGDISTSDNTYYTYEGKSYNGYYNLNIAGVGSNSNSGESTISTNNRFGIWGEYWSASNKFWVDWVYVYKYVSSEPTYSLGGSESQAPADTPSEITLNYPTNNSIQNNTNVIFNVTVLDDFLVENVSIFIDGILNQTNTSQINGTYIFNISIPESNHNWSIFAYDNNSAITQSETRFFISDFFDPVITIDFPFDSVEYNYKPATLNTTASDIHLEACWYSLDNFSTNTTFTCNTNITSLLADEGYNTWRVCANDTVGKESCDSITFEVDTISPSINLFYPENTTYNLIKTEINYTANDTNQDSCWYSIDGGSTNISINFFGENITGLSSIEGLNHWSIYCNDTFGNENSSEVYFTQDTTPFIEFVEPTLENYANISEEVIPMYVNVSTPYFKNITYSLRNINGTIYLESFNNETYSFNYTDIPSAHYQYDVTVCTTTDQCNKTATRHLTHDDISPEFYDFSPEQNSTTEDVNFSVNITDNFYLENATIFIYNESNDLINSSTEIFSENTSSTIFSKVFNLADGIYSWFVRAFDWVGLSNDSGNRTLLVDANAPVVNISYPLNQSYSDEITQLNYTVQDETLFECWYSFDGGATNSSHVLNSENFTITSNPQGSNTITVYCSDNFSRVSSDNITFFVDSISPNITINSPLNTVYNTTEVLFNVTAIDSGVGVSHCLFNLDDSENKSLDLGTSCYQESATVSNQTGIDGDCGLNYSGSYFNDTLPILTTPSSNLYDGNFGSVYWTVTGGGYIYINYNKPQNSVSATSRVKFHGDTVNAEILDSCFNYDSDILSLRYEGKSNGKSSLQCFNGTWNTYVQSTYSENYIYEEAINWTIRESNNDFAYINDSVGIGNHTVDYYCFDYFDNLQTESVNFTIDILTSDLISPDNNSFFANTNTIDLSCNASNFLGINEISLIVDGQTLKTLNVGGNTSINYNNTINVDYGEHNWSCKVNSDLQEVYSETDFFTNEEFILNINHPSGYLYDSLEKNLTEESSFDLGLYFYNNTIFSDQYYLHNKTGLVDLVESQINLLWYNIYTGDLQTPSTCTSPDDSIVARTSGGSPLSIGGYTSASNCGQSQLTVSAFEFYYPDCESASYSTQTGFGSSTVGKYLCIYDSDNSKYIVLKHSEYNSASNYSLEILNYDERYYDYRSGDKKYLGFDFESNYLFNPNQNDSIFVDLDNRDINYSCYNIYTGSISEPTPNGGGGYTIQGGEIVQSEIGYIDCQDDTITFVDAEFTDHFISDDSQFEFSEFYESPQYCQDLDYSHQVTFYNFNVGDYACIYDGERNLYAEYRIQSWNESTDNMTINFTDYNGKYDLRDVNFTFSTYSIKSSLATKFTENSTSQSWSTNVINPQDGFDNNYSTNASVTYNSGFGYIYENYSYSEDNDYVLRTKMAFFDEVPDDFIKCKNSSGDWISLNMLTEELPSYSGIYENYHQVPNSCYLDELQFRIALDNTAFGDFVSLYESQIYYQKSSSKNLDDELNEIVATECVGNSLSKNGDFCHVDFTFSIDENESILTINPNMTWQSPDIEGFPQTWQYVNPQLYKKTQWANSLVVNTLGFLSDDHRFNFWIFADTQALNDSIEVISKDSETISYSFDSSNGYINFTDEVLGGLDDTTDSTYYNVNYKTSNITLDSSVANQLIGGKTNAIYDLLIESYSTRHISDVYSYFDFSDDETVESKFYKCTSGTCTTEITNRADVSFTDNDGDGSYDKVEWFVDDLSNKSFQLQNVVGNPTQISQNLIILNEPIKEFDNIEWRNTITIYNPNNFETETTFKLELPLGSRIISLDDIAKNLQYDELGNLAPYVNIIDKLDPAHKESIFLSSGQTKVFVLEYITDSVTISSSYKYPASYNVGTEAEIVQILTIKNQADAEVTSTEFNIPLEYGEDLVVCEGEFIRGCDSENDAVIDEQSTVKGEYVLEIESFDPSEVKIITLTYNIPTVEVELHEVGQATINGSLLRYDRFDLKGISPFKLDSVKYSYPEINFSNVVEARECGITGECTEIPVSEGTIIDLGLFNVGDEKTVYLWSQPVYIEEESLISQVLTSGKVIYLERGTALYYMFGLFADIDPDGNKFIYLGKAIFISFVTLVLLITLIYFAFTRKKVIEQITKVVKK